MIAIQIRPVGPLSADAARYLGADIDDVWKEGGLQYALLLVPPSEIDAEYSVIKHVEHHEIHGAVHYETQYELDVKDCYWVGDDGTKHKIVNADNVCWELLDHEQR